jgi:hypothetical protein
MYMLACIHICLHVHACIPCLCQLDGLSLVRHVPVWARIFGGMATEQKEDVKRKLLTLDSNHELQASSTLTYPHDSASVPPARSTRVLPALQAVHALAPLAENCPLEHCRHTSRAVRHIATDANPLTFAHAASTLMHV